MRMLDYDTGRALEDICLYLTIKEAQELKDSLQHLSGDGLPHPLHLIGDEIEREITIIVYNNDSLVTLDERSKRLILWGR